MIEAQDFAGQGNGASELDGGRGKLPGRYVDFGAGDVLEIERPDGRRFMVPMNAQAVPEWDQDRLIVDRAFIA